MPVGAPPFYLDPPAGLAERRWPTRADLDAAAPDHPVYIRGIWGYWNRPPVYSIASSAALARAGVTRDTVPPGGVEILKDAAGEPTGVFVEHNLIQVIEFTLLKDAPRFGHADRVRALGESLRRYASRGVTAVYEGHGIAPEVLRVYRETHEAGRLTLRCSLALSPTWGTAAEAERAIPELAAWAGGRGTGDDRLRRGDQPTTAATRRRRILHAGQPYTAWAGFVESANSPADYARQAELAARHGLRINTIVTRCLPEVLDAWEAIAAGWPIRDLRWTLVHLHAATEPQLARIRALGAVATTNPISYLWRSGAAEVARLAGAVETLIPHRSLARLGIPFGLATDNKPANPWLAFNAAVDRRDMGTGEISARQRLRARPARATVGSAVTFAERDPESHSGFAADLALLDVDPLTAPLDEVAEATSRLTMVGGQIVHGDG
jgi:predicted amidohydrolase YtcJ